MENTTLTIIWIITTILTGFGGVILGHFLTKKQIKEELHAINENNIQTEKRHKEEKFENAIQYWGIIMNKPFSREINGIKVESSLYEKIYYFEFKNRENFYLWLKENNITEIVDFINWFEEKEPNCDMKRFLESN